MSKFAMDLAEGKMAEKRAAEHLIKAGIYKDVSFDDSQGEFSDYDAVATTPGGTTHYLEMKNDKMSALTGNFFAEVYCRKKASGLATTKADYYVVTTHNPKQFWRFPVDKLRKLAETCKIVSGGDDSAAVGHLIPVSKFPTECLVSNA